VQLSLSCDAIIVLIRALIKSKVDFCCSALSGMSGLHINRLQSVLNAAARFVFAARQSDDVTSYLHWLKVLQRIQFWLRVLGYRCLHDTAPSYLADPIHPVADTDAHRRPSSADALTLLIPSTRCSFPVAAAQARNSLPSFMKHAPLISIFCRQIRTVLFTQSFSSEPWFNQLYLHWSFCICL